MTGHLKRRRAGDGVTSFMESANGPIIIDQAWWIPVNGESPMGRLQLGEPAEIPIVSGECARSPYSDFRHSVYWDRPWSAGCWYCGARAEAQP